MKKIVWSSLKRNAGLSLLLLAAVVSSILLELLPPLLLGRAVDELTKGVMLSMALVFGYWGLSAAAGILKAAREGLVVAVGEKITHALRSAMSAKLERLPASVFTDSTSGALTARFTSDADAFEQMFSSGIVSLITDLGTVVGMAIVIFQKSLGLGLILLIVLPLLFFFTRHVQKRTLAAHTDNRKAVAKASGFLPETIGNIRSLHVYNAEKFAEQKYDAVLNESFDAIEKTNFYDALYSPVILTVSAAVVAVMMTLAGLQGPFLALFGISVGTAVTVISYVGKIFSPLESIGMEIQTIQAAAAGIARIKDFLNLPERAERKTEKNAGSKKSDRKAKSGASGDVVTDRAGGTSGTTAPLVISDPAIEVKHVSFAYEAGQPVLEDFSMQVHRGERVVLKGRTGAGKSTVFRLVLGLYRPDAGTVRLNEQDPAALPEQEKRRLYGCVEQKFSLVTGNLRDQITLGDENISDEACAKALETVGLNELSTRLSEPYREEMLSHGQKQLLLIARAIVKDPPILLLDEITSGLDAQTEQNVMKALERAAAGRTVLSVSHRLLAGSDQRAVPVESHHHLIREAVNR